MNVAIIIPVRGDHGPLARTLAALRSSAETEHLPVIVAVDGPDDRLVKIAKEHDADVVELPEPRSSYAAREAAIDSLGPNIDIVIFTDAGCLPGDGWVGAHRRALERAALSGGAVIVPLGERPTVAEVVDARRNLTQQAYVENDGFAATCNLAVRRSVLAAVRFDASLESGGDRDFCHRARDAGFELVYTADAAIVHEPRRTWRSVVAKAARVGRGIGTVPEASRPARLPRPTAPLWIGRSHARGLGLRGLPFAVAAAGLEYLRVWTYVRAAHGAGHRERPLADADLVVFLSSRWDAVEATPTRWSGMVEGLVARGGVRSVTVVGYPAMRRKYLFSRTSALVQVRASWLRGVVSLDARLPMSATPWVLDRVGQRRIATALHRALPGSRQTRVVVVNHPLWADAALRVPARLHAFDTDDDWRARPGPDRLHDRIDAGYGALSRFDAVTANTDTWASTLDADYGVRPTVVGNGVHVARYLQPACPPALSQAPAGLPDGPFAVYVGSLDYRVDHELLDEAARACGIPIVVAGPASGDTATRLRTAAVTWIGRVAPAEVPGLLQRASVGLIPHTVDAFTNSMDPLKLLEYLAAGLPVVATPVALPADVAEWVTVAADARSYAGAITRLAAGAGAGTRSPVPAPVAARDWVMVADRLLAEFERQESAAQLPRRRPGAES